MRYCLPATRATGVEKVIVLRANEKLVTWKSTVARTVSVVEVPS